MTKSVHPFMQEDSQLRYKKWHTAINTFCCLYKTKKRSIYKKPMPTFTCQFYHFIGNRAKNILIFGKEWVGDVTFFIFLFSKQFLHLLLYHPQPHLNLPISQVMNSYDKGDVMLGRGEAGFCRGRGRGGGGRGSGVVVVVMSVVLGGGASRGRDLGT